MEKQSLCNQQAARTGTFTGVAAGSIQVEIQNEQGIPLAQYVMDDCAESIDDEIDRKVSWRLGSDVSGLAGQPIRLRFHLKDADLFSLRFRDS